MVDGGHMCMMGHVNYVLFNANLNWCKFHFGNKELNWIEIEFFLNNSKNIDIWILRKEQNLFRSECCMCVPSLVKIDWEMPDKNPR